jgi:hypothetical protein
MAAQNSQIRRNQPLQRRELPKVKNIILADKARKYVVPSAPGKRFPGDEKITDLLYLCYAKTPTVFRLTTRMSRFPSAMLHRKRAWFKDQYFVELAAIKKKHPLGASEDYIASRGEYLSGLLLADFLGLIFTTRRSSSASTRTEPMTTRPRRNGRRSSRRRKTLSCPASMDVSATAASRHFPEVAATSRAQSLRARCRRTSTKTGPT